MAVFSRRVPKIEPSWAIQDLNGLCYFAETVDVVSEGVGMAIRVRPLLLQDSELVLKVRALATPGSAAR